MKSVTLGLPIAIALVSCQAGEQPPENRCAMYWDYYYNAGLGKPLAERRKAEGVDFADIRRIVKADATAKTKACQKILKDTFPDDEALAHVAVPISVAN